MGELKAVETTSTYKDDDVFLLLTKDVASCKKTTPVISTNNKPLWRYIPDTIILCGVKKKKKISHCYNNPVYSMVTFLLSNPLETAEKISLIPRRLLKIYNCQLSRIMCESHAC